MFDAEEKPACLKPAYQLPAATQVSGGAMNIYDPVFSSVQTAAAAELSHGNFRAHLSRGNWSIGDKARAADTSGKGHSFSIYDVLGYALAAKLMKCGIEPKQAFTLAMFDFAHVGSAGRDPAGLMSFADHGVTLYVYVDGAERGQCIGSKSITDAIQLLFPQRGGRGESAIVINLNDLRDRVFHSLKLEARDYE